MSEDFNAMSASDEQIMSMYEPIETVSVESTESVEEDLPTEDLSTIDAVDATDDFVGTSDVIEGEVVSTESDPAKQLELLFAPLNAIGKRLRLIILKMHVSLCKWGQVSIRRWLH